MLHKQLIDSAVKHFEISLQRVEKCFDEITEEDLWNDFNNNLVSVGNLVLHLCGNSTQYVISGLGGQKYFRERDKEFSGKPGLSKRELLEKFQNVISDSCKVFFNLSEEQVEKNYNVQGFNYNGVEIILHVTEHLSYHVGQISFAVKLMKNKDLGYYRGIDLNKQNSSSD